MTENEKRWIEAWRSAEIALAEVRRRELREFDYEARREAIFGLLELAHRFRRPRTTSGMVEMQRLFQKARK